MNYKKIAKAHRYLQDDPDCLFILTNDGKLIIIFNSKAVTYSTESHTDSSFPEGGHLYPGSGSISAALRYALPKRKPIVVGKPNQPMLDSVLEKCVSFV